MFFAADTDTARQAGALACPLLCMLPILAAAIFMIAAMWKLFVKAGQPGWAALIPFYNTYILTCEVAKKDVLWFVLTFVPFVNIVASFIIAIEVARKFRQSEAFGLGLFFLPFIFYPILAFGDARWQGRRRPAPRYDDDYDDEDERPKRRRPRDDEDDDNDDYDDRRRGRRNPRDRDDDDDDDDDDRPRRRRN